MAHDFVDEQTIIKQENEMERAEIGDDNNNSLFKRAAITSL